MTMIGRSLRGLAFLLLAAAICVFMMLFVDSLGGGHNAFSTLVYFLILAGLPVGVVILGLMYLGQYLGASQGPETGRSPEPARGIAAGRRV